MRKTRTQTVSKALHKSSATARVAEDPLKPITILSDVRRSAVDREDLNRYWKSKVGHISLSNQQSYYLQVLQDFTNHRKKTNRAVVFSCKHFPNILKCKDHQKNPLTI